MKISVVIVALFITVLICLLVWAKLRTDHWVLELNSVGTYSSPRAVDLNADGILDIVIGGGGLEYESSEFGVVAINGTDGSLLWKVPARNQVVGSAIFSDIGSDGIPDVFIGGRSAQLWAINGKTGQVIWEYLPSYPSMDLKNDITLLNFFNPQWIPDQNTDGIKDILVAFGGFVKAAPEETDRPTGYLMVIDAKNGKALAKAAMPDGKETYCSPLLFDFNGNGDPTVIYGSGGETINGGLYAIPLSDVMNADLTVSVKLADGNGKGFMAPPVLVDITRDAIPDVITNSFDGRTMAFDGTDFHILWERRPGNNLETYTTVAPIDMNRDGTLDFFSTYGIGTWPNIDTSIQVVLDGTNGEELFRDEMGTLQYSSPVVFDFTDDGNLDVLLSTNYVTASPDTLDQRIGNETQQRHFTENRVFDLTNGTNYRFGESVKGKNLSSTPLITNLDDDGKIDIIVCRMSYAKDFFTEKGLVIERFEMDLPTEDIEWGSYMGSTFDGIYPSSENSSKKTVQ